MTTKHWNMQHTAGHDKHGQTAVYDKSGKDIAIVYDGDANARLIAAAPDLLAACKAALQCQLDGLDENTVDALEAAIAKATEGSV